MTTAPQHRASGLWPRLSRVLAAIATSVALVAAPVLVAAPAYAADAGSTSISGDTDLDYGWTDVSLAPMTKGETYSDSIRNLYYTSWTVDQESLPPGISVSPSDSERSETLTFSGTPTETGDFSVAVSSSGEGSIDITILFHVGSSGVAPTWTDNTLGALQQGTAFGDGVVATGDPTIVYAVTSGTLPAGLALDTATGAVTGTPTSAGAYDFTITATNDYGHVDQNFAGTIAAASATPAAPTIGLSLNFQAGTPITDASSTISADGLKVGSTYTLTMHSTPVILYTGTIGLDGGFTWKVALPADTPPGVHQLILTGVAPDGTTLTRNAWFTLGAGGTIRAVSLTGPTGLANTGVEPGVPLGLGAALIVAGAALLLVRRRRRAGSL